MMVGSIEDAIRKRLKHALGLYIMATMHCEIVSAEKELFSGEIEMLSARGTIGELGIMPGHAPLLTGIQPGTVILRLADGTEEIFLHPAGFGDPARIRHSAGGCNGSCGRFGRGSGGRGSSSS